MFENPFGVPYDEILRMIVSNPPEVVAQTVFGKYVESSGLVFSGELIQNMIDRTLPPVRGEVFLDKARLEESRAEAKHYSDRWRNPFHTGVDFGRQTDYTVITTIDVSSLPAKLVYYKRLNRVPWEAIYAEVGRAAAMWGPNILCDASGPAGDVVMDALGSRQYCALHHRTLEMDQRCTDRGGNFIGCERESYIWLNVCDGYYFSTGQGQAKKELVEHLRNVLGHGYRGPATGEDFGWLRTPAIPQLEEELTFYTWDDKRLQTDCLFSLALSCWSGLEDIVGDPAVGAAYGV